MRDNAVVQYFIQILSVIAGILLVKMMVSFLPNSGFLGSVKAVVASV